MTDIDEHSPGRPTPPWHRPVVVALLAAYWVLAVTAAADKSATFDEGVYLAGGYSYWKYHDYRLNPESGHLTQRLAALPLLAGSRADPDRDAAGWREGDGWRVAPAFLYDPRNDPDRQLLYGRMVCATLSAAVGLLVYGCSRRLWGPTGGLVSLALFASCPTMLANGPLVQSDMAAALFFTAALAGVWAVLHRVSPTRVAASCAAVAGLFLAKLSAPLIVPVAGALALLRVAAGRPLPVDLGRGRVVSGRWARAAVFAGLAALHAAVVWAAVWATFGFRFAAVNAPGPNEAGLMEQRIDELAGRAGRLGGLVRWLDRSRLLPEAYVYGVAFQAEVRYMGKPAFLNGDYYPTGTVWYFPNSVLKKTPLPLFGVLGLAAWGWVRARRPGDGQPAAPRLYALAPLLVFAGVYAAAAVTSRLNIGHRYLAPVYPSVFVLAGAAGLWLRPGGPRADGRRGWQAVATGVLLLGAGVEAARCWPDYLAYFNPAAGGPRAGYRQLVDSSLDWGQDLPGLKRWLDDRGLPDAETPVYLSYFGTAPVRHHGIRARRLFSVPPQAWDEPPAGRPGGVYCVSATILSGVRMWHFPGTWTPGYEARYQELRAFADRRCRADADPAERDSLRRAVPEARWPKMAALLEEAEFARLCHFLRHREPDDAVGHSILIYHLSDEDVIRAREGPVE